MLAISKIATHAINGSMKRIAFRVSKHAPEILLTAGIGGVVTSTVLACRATIKAKDVVEQAKNDLNDISVAETAGEEVYSVEDKEQDLKTVYIRSAFELTKLYAPSVIIGGLSIASLVCSHGIMRNRVGTLVAAYTALHKSFMDYRSRVSESFGEQKELEVYHDVKTYKEKKKDVEGIRLAKKNNRELVDGYSIYARCFDEYNPNWQDNAEDNLKFLRSTQKYLNSKLIRDGFLSLNDAYYELGFERTSEGQLVGWIYDPNRPATDPGDNCVSFGLYDPKRGAVLGDFINGKEKSVFLDFNIDGVIIDRI